MGEWIIEESQQNLQDVYCFQLRQRARASPNDRSHHLFGELQLLRSGQCFVVPKTRMKCFRNSFVAAAGTVINKPSTRCILSLELISVIISCLNRSF